MTSVRTVVGRLANEQKTTGKPLALILAGHNGAGKSTMWDKHLSVALQIPLINADRMMRSVLPEVSHLTDLPTWARTLRDHDGVWMRVAQNGVNAFIQQAMAQMVPFAVETVFSHWRPQPDGSVESKIDLIRELQTAGYYVLLIFVGLSNANLSALRVGTRKALGGHAVGQAQLRNRFPRTQNAIRHAVLVADASILVDNSRDEARAFTVCRIQQRDHIAYDIRDSGADDAAIAQWMKVVC